MKKKTTKYMWLGFPHLSLILLVRLLGLLVLLSHLVLVGHLTLIKFVLHVQLWTRDVLISIHI